MTGRTRSLLIGGASSALLLWLAARSVDWTAFRAGLAAARPEWLPAIAAGSVLTLWLRVERWRLMLPAGARRAALFRLITIGLAVNNVLPARLGEVVRTVLAARELGLPFLTVLASVFIERLLDALTILALFFLGAAAFPDSAWVAVMRPALLPVFLTGLTGFAAAFCLEWALERSTLLHRLLRGHPKLRSLTDQLIVGLRPLRAPGTLALILFWSAALWTADVNNYWMAARAVPPGVEVPHAYAAIVLATAGMSTVLPAAPGYIGVFEFAVKSALVPFGADPSRALACAAFLHLVAYVVTTGLGIWFLWREGRTLDDLWKQVQEHAK